jgi:hypothetical protein
MADSLRRAFLGEGWYVACSRQRSEASMKRQRTRQHEQDSRDIRASSPGARKERRTAVADDSSQDDVDGQLGPDELPDVSEIAMNSEAKRHHR